MKGAKMKFKIKLTDSDYQEIAMYDDDEYHMQIAQAYFKKVYDMLKYVSDTWDDN